MISTGINGPDQRQDLHCVVSDISAECRELRTALAAAEAREIKLRDELEKIACLGNGNMRGNSTGNCMAIDALAQHHDDSALREMIAEVYEECAKVCEDDAKGWTDYSCEMAARDCADAIRALAEKAKDTG